MPAVVISTVMSYIFSVVMPVDVKSTDQLLYKEVLVGGIEHHHAFSGDNISYRSIPLIRDKFGSNDTYVVAS